MNTIVDFKTAKLLNRAKCYIYSKDRYNKQGSFEYSKSWSISAPTIADAVMWLYDKRGFWISVGIGQIFNQGKHNLTIYQFNGMEFEQMCVSNEIHGPYDKPSDAYLAGIEFVVNSLT